MSAESGLHAIAGAIVLAAVIAVVVPIGWSHWQAVQAERVMAEAARQMEAEFQAAERRAAAANRQRQVQADAARYRAARTGPRRAPIMAGESCVGGYLVRRLPAPQEGFEQVLYRGQPVRC